MKVITADDLEIDLALPRPDPKLPTPLYHQLYAAISEKIISGDLPTGSKLPSEKQFINKFGVSRITIKRALDELAKSGLVARKRGRGTIVITNTDLNFQDGMSDYVKNVARLRDNTKAEITERRNVAASELVAKNLKVGTGATVERVAHILSSNNKPISYVVTYLPLGMTGDLTPEDLIREPLLTLLLKQGVRIDRAEQKITACAAGVEEAEFLQVALGTPLLKIRCIMVDKDGIPVEDIYAWYNPELYQYQMTLSNIDPSQS